MKSLTLPEAVVASPAPDTSVGERRGLTPGESLSAYLDLTKPRITFLVVLSALSGFALGSPRPMSYWLLLHTAVGVALLSSGIGTLNQYLERSLDGLMRRTRTRPLPAGKMPPRRALLFGVLTSALATLYLALLVNPLTAAWGAVAFGSYLFVYTPLKTRTTWCTFIGAIPGALPPLLGWTAARNEVGVEALVLFAILFLWQFPHFHAIAWMYREDYARAGIRVLPVVDWSGTSSGTHSVTNCLALLPVALLPTLVGMAGTIYFVVALLLSGGLLWTAITLRRSGTLADARRLMMASLLYLPLLLAVMAIDKLPLP
jgi:heme o synthase